MFRTENGLKANEKTYTGSTNAVDIIFTVVGEIIVLKRRLTGQETKIWGITHDNIAYILHIYETTEPRWKSYIIDRRDAKNREEHKGKKP